MNLHHTKAILAQLTCSRRESLRWPSGSARWWRQPLAPCGIVWRPLRCRKPRVSRHRCRTRVQDSRHRGQGPGAEGTASHLARRRRAPRDRGTHTRVRPAAPRGCDSAVGQTCDLRWMFKRPARRRPRWQASVVRRPPPPLPPPPPPSSGRDSTARTAGRVVRPEGERPGARSGHPRCRFPARPPRPPSRRTRGAARGDQRARFVRAALGVG